jgi:hypothetical protein
MNKSIFILITTLFIIGCGALDYNKSIGLGYSIHRMNKFEKIIGPDNGRLLYTTSQDLGPLNQYSIFGKTIIAKHYGAKKRLKFKGDNALEKDTTITKYIIINTQKNTYEGPLNKLPSKFNKLQWLTAP